MPDSATHSIRFFSVYPSMSKSSYVERCHLVGIHMTTTVVAFIVLVCSGAKVFTHIAGFERYIEDQRQLCDAV